MSDFKGTKGKWEFSYDKYDDNFTIYSDYAIGSTRNSDNEDKANALLISKAPEMLEMLEYAKEALKAVYSPTGKTKPIIERIEKLIKSCTEL